MVVVAGVAAAVVVAAEDGLCRALRSPVTRFDSRIAQSAGAGWWLELSAAVAEAVSAAVAYVAAAAAAEVAYVAAAAMAEAAYVAVAAVA